MESSPHYPDLSVGYVFGRAWEIFKENMVLVFAITIVQILVISVSAIIPLLPLLIGGPLQVGVYYTLVRMVRGEQVELKDMFDGFQEFGRSLGVYLLYTLIVAVGFIFLVIPGIVLALGLYPAMYLVMDENYGIGDTLQEAWEMAKGYKMSLFVLVIAIIGLSILGLLAFIIGIIFVGVYAQVVMAVAYDELAEGRRTM